MAFRDRKIFDFISTTRVARIDLTRDGQGFTLVRRKESSEESALEVWRMTKPVAAPADPTTANNIVGRLFSSLQAEKLVAEKADELSEYGLDDPPLRVTLTLKAEDDEKPQQHSLIIGKKVESAAGDEDESRSTASSSGTEQYYAKEPAGDLVFTIAADKVEPLQGELRERKIFSVLSSEVIGVTLNYHDRKLELQYTTPEGESEKQWSFAGEAPFELDKEKVKTLIDGLANLQAQRFAQYEGELKDEYGLAEPALVVEITLSGDEKKTLSIGAAKDDALYAASGDLEGAVFEIGADQFGDLASKTDYLSVPPPEEPKDDEGTDAQGKTDESESGQDDSDSEAEEVGG